MIKTKILIIDHNDSFTYNLVQLVTEKGGEVSVMPYHNIDFNSIEKFDGIILSPGPGLPEEYPKTTQIIDKYKGIKPILGVCMGMQLIATYFDGELYNLSTVYHGQPATINKINPSSLFENIHLPIKVGLYHSWAIKKDTLNSVLEATAKLDNGTIMAIQHKSLPIHAVQFHPESFITKQGGKIIQNWLKHIVFPFPDFDTGTP